MEDPLNGSNEAKFLGNSRRGQFHIGGFTGKNILWQLFTEQEEMITVEVNFSSVCPASQGKPSQGRGEEGGAAAERGAALARLGLNPWLEPPPDNCPCLPDTNIFVYIQIQICNTKIQIHIYV